ncbi:Amino acid permease, partial [Oryctes borbonicus]
MNSSGNPLEAVVESTTFSMMATEVRYSDTQSVATLVIAIIAVIVAITVLFLMAVFIDCRQQKIQNQRVKKSKAVLQNVIPHILKSHDRARIVENEHHPQQTDNELP